MKLYIQFATKKVKMVDVELSDEISILLKLLNLKTKDERKSKFIYKGQTISVSSCLTFEENGFEMGEDNIRLKLFNQAISGNFI